MFEQRILHYSTVCPAVPRDINSKSAGDNSSVLFGFESCVLLHANINSTARDDNGYEKNHKKAQERTVACVEDA